MNTDRYHRIIDMFLIELVVIETTRVLGSDPCMFPRQLENRITAQAGDRMETTCLYERLSNAVARKNSVFILAAGCVNA